MSLDQAFKNPVVATTQPIDFFRSISFLRIEKGSGVGMGKGIGTGSGV